MLLIGFADLFVVEGVRQCRRDLWADHLTRAYRSRSV
jgi:hypothetical protein